MNLLESQGYSFLCDYIHLTFLIGVMVSYLYFRKYRVSIGGTLAVGYLAASLYAPLNSLVTVLVSMFAFVLIRFVVLKLFLPRPRQIFAIGLAIGVICGLAWLGALRIPVLPDQGTIRPGPRRRDCPRYDHELAE